ncbi:MAG: hypothetical protein LUC22_02245 [Prevotella sp.]|nr:hypothetical protein [Prevotella sp.]
MRSKILRAFPEVNPIWLSGGEGEMLLPAVASRPRTAPSGDDADTLISLIRQRTAEIESLLAALQTVRNVPERDTGRAVHIPYSSAACPAV